MNDTFYIIRELPAEELLTGRFTSCITTTGGASSRTQEPLLTPLRFHESVAMGERPNHQSQSHQGAPLHFCPSISMLDSRRATKKRATKASRCIIWRGWCRQQGKEEERGDGFSSYSTKGGGDWRHLTCVRRQQPS